MEAAPGQGSGDRSYVFHPGFAGRASIGYGIGGGLRAEIEGDYLDNVVRGYREPAPRRAGGLEEKYGGMVNMLYDLSLGLGVFPYVGVGTGGQEVRHRHFNESTLGFVFPVQEGSQTVGAFAYQGVAGVAVPMPSVQGLSFTAEYRFSGLADPLPAFSAVSYHGEDGAGAREDRHFSNDFNHSVMLGLRYALFRPAPPLPPAASAASPLPGGLFIDRSFIVFFDWDSADLSQRGRQIVAEAARESARNHAVRIQVNGYTDSSGTAGYNRRLSVRRALSVMHELVRDGIGAGEIGVDGLGENNPLVQTAKGVREPQNRRVEILFK